MYSLLSSLDSDSYVKICDNALSRDLFPDDYHCLCDNENRPLKWMALESLQQKNFYNQQTDIWSLGVLFWELATLALTPFEEVDIFELTPYLSDGFRLAQPINCPDELYVSNILKFFPSIFTVITLSKF